MAQFAPGTSGNPNGARPGPRFGRATLEKAIRTHAGPILPEVVERLAEAALRGDTTAGAALLAAYSTATATPATKTTSGV